MKRTMKSLLATAVVALALTLAVPCLALADDEVISSASSSPISLDTRTGARDSDGSESLRYSSSWAADSTAELKIMQDGKEIASGLTGDGTYDWEVPYDGTYELKLVTDSGEELGSVTFVVKGKGIPNTGDSSLALFGLACLMAALSAAILAASKKALRHRA